MSLELILLIIGLLIIFPLAGYAGWLLWQLRKQNIIAQELEDTKQTLLAQKAKEAEKSISVLLLALQKEQLSATEAAMRVSHFSRMLNWEEQDMLAYNAFHQLAQETSHIPILDQWKALSREEQEAFDKQRTDLEAMHQLNIESASNSLLGILNTKTPINIKD